MVSTTLVPGLCPGQAYSIWEPSPSWSTTMGVKLPAAPLGAVKLTFTRSVAFESTLKLAVAKASPKPLPLACQFVGVEREEVQPASNPSGFQSANVQIGMSAFAR